MPVINQPFDESLGNTSHMKYIHYSTSE